MSPTTSPSCASCKFFAAVSSRDPDPRRLGVGVCRAHAPAPVQLPGGITPEQPAQLTTFASAVWPLVTSGDWCGDWAHA